MKLCFASNNANKIHEVKQVLGSPYEITSLQEIGCTEELPETTGTIVGNSKQKATYVYEKYKTPCFADDTGLEVLALNGAPGVDSAFYAGPQRSSQDNINLLLKNLAPFQDRSAQFKTVITLCIDGNTHVFEGVVKGTITMSPAGANGFGYDPIFQPEGFTRTFAEMTTQEKNNISHRWRAIEQLVLFLKSTYYLESK